jgi:hypothetical protein
MIHSKLNIKYIIFHDMNNHRLLLSLPLLLFVLLGNLSLVSEVYAAEINGKVIATRGDSVTIKINAGPTPRIGDKVEISFGDGEDKVPVGTWRVTKVEGSTVSADVVSKDGDATLDMNATIFSSSVARKQPQRKKQESVIPSTDVTEELPWLKDKKQPRRAPPPVKEKPVVSAPAEIERSTAAEVTPKASAAILHMTTKQYEMVWKDSGSGADEDFASFRPRAEQGYFPLGDVANASPWQGKRYPMPGFTTILVKSGAMEVKKPTGYKRTWNSEGSYSDAPFSSWEPIPPTGYKCLGDVGSRSLDKMPSTDAIRCIPEQCVKQTELGNKIWNDKGSGAIVDFSAWLVPIVNLYIGTPVHNRPRGSIYTINSDCLEMR